MATAPYGVRLLVGAATVAVEETMKLPKTILMYPMTLASQAAHLVMRFQQNLAELAIKGDSTLENIFPPKDEQPEWATFDEDLPEAVEAPGPAGDGNGEGDRRTEGRFALYSLADAASDAAPLKQGRKSQDAPAAPQPSVVSELDYAALTLAQLRARLQSLSVDELEALLAYEQATKARAPFETLLANRITRANAK
ncbi:lipid droplet-associated protein [Mycobacterium paraffinicum]|nr:lipid droplet-associated protein [Mycobacterium paraffinicum]MCV7312791.1 lipid droplet-associated protein [Mycobacterium paraffinicum]